MRNGKKMKKIIRTRNITKTSRRIIVCHGNFPQAADGGEALPTLCPNCGEPILPPNASALLGESPAAAGPLIENEKKSE